MHIVSAGAWIGIDVVIAILVGTAMVTDDPGTAGVAFRTLDLVAVWPLLAAGLVCLATGVTLALGGGYGLLRYWWVAVKLTLNLLLTGLVLVALRPTVAAAAVQGRQLLDGTATSWSVGNLIYPPIVSPLALLFAVTLAVYKPWGRLRPHRRRSRSADGLATEPPA